MDGTWAVGAFVEWDDDYRRPKSKKRAKEKVSYIDEMIEDCENCEAMEQSDYISEW